MCEAGGAGRHAALYRLREPPAGAGLRGASVWYEYVPSASGTPAALRRRAAELVRGPGPSSAGPFRAVVLDHADGVVDLVVTAGRHVHLPEVVERVTGLPGGAEPVRSGTAPAGCAQAVFPAVSPVAGPPGWGLVTAGAPPGGGRHSAVGELARAIGAEDLTRLLRAAVEFVLARYECREPPGPTAAELLSSAARKPVWPDAGVAVADASDLPRPGDGAELLDYLPFQQPPYPMALCPLRVSGTRIRLEVLFRTDWFSAGAVERFSRHVLHVARHLAGAAPDAGVAGLELLDAQEREALRRLGGAGVPAPARQRTIHGIFAEQAALHRDRTAVVCDGDRLTYREVEQRAGRTAAVLRDLGARPGKRVGVCMERSADLVVVLLAVLMSGAAYVPLDPAQPAERIAWMLRDADPVLVVGAERHVGTVARRHDPADLFRRAGEPSHGAASPGEAGYGEPAAAREPRGEDARPEDAAYVIYTSGSTGRPKGVVVPHRNVVALLDATAGDFRLGPDDVWTMFHSAAFDFSVWEMFGCLLTGGTLVVVPYWVSRSPEEFHRLLADRRVTVLSQTPSAFAQLVRVDEQARAALSPRLVIFGGEPLDAKVLRPWLDRRPASVCRLVNMYGITETTVHVTAHTLTRADALSGTRSVGRPLPGWRVHIADPQGRMLPAGVEGEIQVSGAGVAAAYLRRPELTAERFLTDPDTGLRAYRSGDRGRLLPDGTLEHLGRLDAQIQLRGFRVEPDEIRSVLLDDPSVREAAVVVSHPGTERARLDAYVVLTDGDAARAAGIRRRAARFLPDHMVPSTVTAVPALPLTANGKLDASRLPAPVPSATLTRRPGGPDGTLSERGKVLLSVWESVFGTSVGLDDDFFELGGNSLLAVRLAAALRERAMPDLSLRDLYRAPTVRTLLAFLDSGEAGPRGEARAARPGRLLDLP
ncbi:amino acid adenylation domain-containing protein [Streptomyces sp. NPDC001348]